MSKYFIQKNGVYAAGVYWMGDDIAEGMSRGMKLADLDHDDYHDWRLYEYVEYEPISREGKEWYDGTHFTSLPHI